MPSKLKQQAIIILALHLAPLQLHFKFSASTPAPAAQAATAAAAVLSDSDSDSESDTTATGNLWQATLKRVPLALTRSHGHRAMTRTVTVTVTVLGKAIIITGTRDDGRPARAGRGPGRRPADLELETCSNFNGRQCLSASGPRSDVPQLTVTGAAWYCAS
jgi:hypothetical protein